MGITRRFVSAYSTTSDRSRLGPLLCSPRSINTVVELYEEIRELRVSLVGVQEHARQPPSKPDRRGGEPFFSQLTIAKDRLSHCQNLFAASHEAAVIDAPTPSRTWRARYEDIEFGHLRKAPSGKP